MISNAGTYKGTILDAGVSATRKKGLPQLVATFLATHRHNEATGEWDDWSEYAETGIGYFVLVHLDDQNNVKQCFAYEQIMEATGWDGVTYSGLAALDLVGMDVQFMVVEDTYEGKVSMKVNRIASADAEMGLRKLSGQDLTNLDAQFSVPVTKPLAVATKPKTKSKGKGKTTKAPPTAPKPPTVTKPKVQDAPEDTPLEPCTEMEAYEACTTTNDASENPVPEEILNAFWSERAVELAKDTENVTGSEWAAIRDAVLGDMTIPF